MEHFGGRGSNGHCCTSLGFEAPMGHLTEMMDDCDSAMNGQGSGLEGWTWELVAYRW